MPRPRFWLSLVVGVAAVVLAAGPAWAQSPIGVGAGGSPHVAVDANGAGYLTWAESSTSTFRYCKLPPGATACTAPFSYTDADQDLDGGYALLPGDGRALLVDLRGSSSSRPKLLWTSGDAGATFAGPTQIASMPATGANMGGGALVVPAGALGLARESILTLGQVGGVTAAFQASGTTAGTSASLVELQPNVATALALQGDVLLAALSDFGQVSWTRYVGPVPATPETLDSAANWSPPAAIGPRYGAQLETRLVSGPGGAYVGYAVDAGGGSDAFVVRRFEGAGFGAPTTIARDFSAVDLVASPDGRLHLLYADRTGLHYRYTTAPGNTTWTAPQTVATNDSYAFPRLAVNTAGNGWATWAGTTGVKAIPLRGTYTGPQTDVKTSGSGGSYTLGIPRRCVSPGQRFRVTLTWKRQKRKGNLFVKVRRADFYLGTTRLRTDTTAPFVHTYDVRVTQPRGSTLRLRARAFIKVRRGKEPKKSIVAKVKVCS